MLVDLTVDIVVLSSKSQGETKVVLLSSIGGGNQSAELWRGRESGAYAVYHQDAYYDADLATRRSKGTMRHPRHKRDFMVLVGSLWGAQTWPSEDYWELAKTTISLTNVSVDELL